MLVIDMVAMRTLRIDKMGKQLDLPFAHVGRAPVLEFLPFEQQHIANGQVNTTSVMVLCVASQINRPGQGARVMAQVDRAGEFAALAVGVPVKHLASAVESAVGIGGQQFHPDVFTQGTRPRREQGFELRVAVDAVAGRALLVLDQPTLCVQGVHMGRQSFAGLRIEHFGQYQKAVLLKIQGFGIHGTVRRGFFNEVHLSRKMAARVSLQHRPRPLTEGLS
jgi:hypothetical protein